MAAKRDVPAGVVRVIDRRQSGAAGPHSGRTSQPRGTVRREAIRSSKENW